MACGSGHILLAAARRIGSALAVLRTGDDQPSPAAFREAVRDVIRHCIYGMDLNPLAVELCKVALWLEAHVPGQPLTFLDHRIHCGNAIVGLARADELKRGIPDEAFKTVPGDDKDIAAALRRQNKAERKGEQSFDFGPRVAGDIRALAQAYSSFEHVPEQGADDYYKRRDAYDHFLRTPEHWRLRVLADLQVAQFYLPKTRENTPRLTTHDTFHRWLEGLNPTGQQSAAATSAGAKKRFAHWFIELWDVMNEGGFDLILGNPPYLGGQALSGTYGHPFCEWVKWEYAPAGLSDLVVFFLRRIYDLLRPGGFIGLITTNSIKDGDNRRDGLDWLIANGGIINMAIRGTKWPGQAKVVVSLVTIHRGPWAGLRSLDGKEVTTINSYFEDSEFVVDPVKLAENDDKIFQGVIFLGDGFLLTRDDAARMCRLNPRCEEVVFPILNGQELNNRPDQSSDRRIINFFDWPLAKAADFGEAFERVRDLVKPVRETDNRALYRERWWQYGEPRRKLTTQLTKLNRCFGTSRVTKYLNFSACPADLVFSNNVYVLTTDRWDEYAIVQSTLHEAWARKYSMSLKQDLQYSPTDCFATFPFPRNPTYEAALAAIGEAYHEHRRVLMRGLWLGLTDLYNLFHRPDLTADIIAAERGDRATIAGAEGFTHILRLRELHTALDTTVLTAFGWDRASEFGPALELRHDFHALDNLAEKDRIRYTLHPDSRREVLARLLKLNHQRAEQAATAPVPLRVVKPARKGKPKPDALPRKHSKGINFKRGAIAAYAVDRLADRWEFGRTQMEKVLYLAQQGLGVDLELEFQREAAGPFDEEIHKLESLAKKEGWFVATERAGTYGTAYKRGPRISERCGAATSILGEAKGRVDWMLDQIAKMDTERAELWATVHAAWNDLICSGSGASDDHIVQEVYAWHSSKARFQRERIVSCIEWMRRENFTPQGYRFETRVKPSHEELDLGLDLFGRASPASTVRALETAREPYESGLIYSVQLVRALLAEADGSLPWPRLVDAFTLATQPAQMCARATGEDVPLTKKWRKIWRETPPAGALVTAIEQLGAASLDVNYSGGVWLIGLQDGPKPPLNRGVMDDAWLALRVLGPAPATPTPQPSLSVPEFAAWTQRLETAFAH